MNLDQRNDADKVKEIAAGGEDARSHEPLRLHSGRKCMMGIISVPVAFPPR